MTCTLCQSPLSRVSDSQARCLRCGQLHVAAVLPDQPYGLTWDEFLRLAREPQKPEPPTADVRVTRGDNFVVIENRGNVPVTIGDLKRLLR